MSNLHTAAFINNNKNHTIIKNTITNQEILRSDPIDEEVFIDGGVMITETDMQGIITYANNKFIEMTGFTREELIGSPHSINRHPDMPKGAFRGMWKTISSRKTWQGYMKNLRKDGRYYWVMVYIQPKIDEKGNLTGYAAGRKIASSKAIKEIEEEYVKYYGDEYMENKFFMGGELCLGPHLATRALY